MTEPRFQRSPAVLETVVAEEVVLLSPELRFLSLNSSAARIWELLEQPSTVEDLSGVLVAEYDVDRETADRAASEVVAAFVSSGSVTEVGPTA